ncbi:hypothetical protein JQ633_00890 [Bradyrhizobium tropiciagri]|uniref:hypothetical protein n=1 Tax=Bradyrhizobium tropiciagri TaxID=312253 RepID=UPI001BA9FD8B|nr:hypothetical protein [Bradyrhizobium tropiciagri]MBR0868896.1 hypothetical protein [Bradyrhizobium tropiciagri]
MSLAFEQEFDALMTRIHQAKSNPTQWNAYQVEANIRQLVEDECARRLAAEGAREYVNRAIASYDGDPADNQFQRGHLAALEMVRDEAFPPVSSTGGTNGSSAT